MVEPAKPAAEPEAASDLAADLREANERLLLAALREQELEQLREETVALVSHDLRGPLSAARLAAQLLQRQPGDPEQTRSFASRILTNLNRMEIMIHDLLDAQRVRAGQALPLVRESCDAVVLAREAMEDLRTLRPMLLAGDRELRGEWSPGQLRRAIWNLLSNAVKYGTDGEPVTVTVQRVGDLARIAVHNRGAAIPAEEQALLFTPFVRAKAALSAHISGWGLGLTVVRGCAEAHGGRVSVASSPDDGTTFVLELPVSEPVAAARP